MTTRIETDDNDILMRDKLNFMTNFHDNKDWNHWLEPAWCRIILYDQLPWQQGLKLLEALEKKGFKLIFMTNFHDNKDWNTAKWQLYVPARRALWPTSMTTRIETHSAHQFSYPVLFFMTNFHDNKDWNQMITDQSTEKVNTFMTNFHDNKDWNSKLYAPFLAPSITLWPTSMTTRIETSLYSGWVFQGLHLYDQLPWQQGLKQLIRISLRTTHLSLWPTSMTTRIETVQRNMGPFNRDALYDQLPWQQGLKRASQFNTVASQTALWPTSMTTRIETQFSFHPSSRGSTTLWPTSMTTRIETSPKLSLNCRTIILYDQLPWQQGLKREWWECAESKAGALWPTSMTTRIETRNIIYS